MGIRYDPPFIERASGEQRGFHSTEERELRRMHEGPFLMCSLDDAVRIWAKIGGVTHNEVFGVIRREEKRKGNKAYNFVLGGGSISVDDEGKPVYVGESSYSYGGLPNKVVQDYFAHFGYKKVTTKLVEEYVKDEAVRWFKEHGVDI